METEKSLNYLRAEKKVETLKGFYGHLTAYIIVNVGIILVSANVFGKGEIDFSGWEIYVTPIFWGIGLVSHGIYVFFELYVKNNYLRRWEEKKINQFLEDDNFGNRSR